MIIETTPVPASKVQPGANVKRYCLKRGWMFGKVIDIVLDTDGEPLWRANVKWIRQDEPELLPQFCLQEYPGEPSEQQNTLIRFYDKTSGDLLQTMTEVNYRRNAYLPWAAREMPIEQIIDAFNEASLTVRGEVCR